MKVTYYFNNEEYVAKSDCNKLEEENKLLKEENIRLKKQFGQYCSDVLPKKDIHMRRD